MLVTDAPVNTVTIHPENREILFAGTGAFYAIDNPGELYVSKDGGTKWSQTSLQGVVVNSISVSPTDPDIIYT